MTDDRDSQIEVLEIGAGREPHPESTTTLDIREDLDHIDFPGINIGTDRWPITDQSVQAVRAHHVLEHIPPDQIGHVWRELNRVLVSGGTALIELPHANTWAAATDLTHYGTGGTTPEVTEYFGGSHEQYWPELNWNVTAHAEVSFPNLLRPSFRIKKEITRPYISYELTKFPFVDAIVTIHIQKQGDA